EVSNNPLFNVAKFNSNHSRLYLHEVYNDKIIWDTIKYDVEDAELDARINETQYDQMFKSYTLFSYPMRSSALPYIFNLANHNRWYYDYARNDFRKFHRSRSIWVDSPENAQKCNKIGQGKKIRLFYRIEIKDGRIVKTVNEMLYSY
ncbi:MAG: hypothetical protein J6K74_03995, partial [Marinifilaceae bacterium]|nr:hypothetical protein [Marinifilaceae bacterium]